MPHWSSQVSAGQAGSSCQPVSVLLFVYFFSNMAIAAHAALEQLGERRAVEKRLAAIQTNAQHDVMHMSVHWHEHGRFAGKHFLHQSMYLHLCMC
jgi:hypothetical protein